jgi:hypothetical protein
MLIEHNLDVFVVSDQVCILVWSQVEVDALPDFLHFFQTHFDVVLLGGSLTDLTTCF